MTATMTYGEYLAVHPDYRSVTRNPHRCCVLENDPHYGTVLAEVRITDDYSATVSRKTPDGYLAATVRTHSLGDQAPYFSVTGELWDSEGWYRRGGPDGRLRACGMLHDDILRAFPQLAPLVALHLADATTGEPMYAYENGWYHYSGGDTDAARRLLRDPNLPDGIDENAFRDYVTKQADRWNREAADGRALILQLAAAA